MNSDSEDEKTGLKKSTFEKNPTEWINDKKGI